MIFNLFRAKPTLKEIIPRGFVDIHSHILPGLDDGAKNLEESLFLIKKMGELGFSKIIGTPHTYPGLYNNDTKSIIDSYKKIVNKLNGTVKLSYASEYMLDKSVIEKAKNNELLCLKDNYILVEMSYISKPVNLDNIIFNLIINGYTPILAHPERYRFLHRNFEEFKKLKLRGCLFQINLLSTIGYYGKDVLKITNKLIDKNMVDFLGSDIHDVKHIKMFDNKIEIKDYKKLEKIFSNNNIFI